MMLDITHTIVSAVLTKTTCTKGMKLVNSKCYCTLCGLLI